MLQLVDRGKVSLDDPISKYHAGVPNGDHITIRELARMQSGLFNYFNDPEKALRLLQSLAALGTVMTRDIYADFEIEARKRLASRDPDDWPILAAALALGCPIWTEDTDFFGCGVATWTSASIGSSPIVHVVGMQRERV